MDAPTILAQELTVGYGSRTIIDGLSFSIQGSGLVALLGNNGVGKSTLLKAMAGLEPHTGSLMITGKPAYLPQVAPLSHDLSVADVLLSTFYGDSPFGFYYSASQHQQAVSALTAQRLEPELMSRSFTTLSGGQRQRVWLAWLALQQAAVLLLDEPLQSLDIKQKDHSMQWLVDQAKDKLVLFSTHDLGLLPATGHFINLQRPTPRLQAITPQAMASEIAYLIGS